MKAFIAALIAIAPLAWSEVPDSYGLRTLGRAEARWMGSLSGAVPDPFISQAIPDMYEWNRTLGRSEAHYTNGLVRTSEGVFVREAAPEATVDGCTLSEERRAEGRAEAKEVEDPDAGREAVAGSDIRPKC